MPATKTQKWTPEKIKALRARVYTRKDGDLHPISQTDFGLMLGAYHQPTISGWENTEGPISRRSCMDLDRVEKQLNGKVNVWDMEKMQWETPGT